MRLVRTRFRNNAEKSAGSINTEAYTSHMPPCCTGNMQEVVLLVDLPAFFVRSVHHLEARLGVAVSLEFVSFLILTWLLYPFKHLFEFWNNALTILYCGDILDEISAGFASKK